MPNDSWIDYEAMFVADTMYFLKWVMKRAGKPARIPEETPLNFYQAQRMEAYGSDHDGPLVKSQKVEGYNTFVWTVTEVGLKFMREHGWSEGEMEVPPPQLPNPVFKDGAVHWPPVPKKAGDPVTTIFKLDRQRRVHELNPWKAPDVIREGLTDGSNTVMVHDGELYAASFEELMGSDPSILFEEE